MLVDLPPGQGRPRRAWAPSIFLVSGEDLKPEFSFDSPKAGFGSSSGNDFSSALLLTFVTDTKLVGLLDCDLMGPPSSAKLLTDDFDH